MKINNKESIQASKEIKVHSMADSSELGDDDKMKKLNILFFFESFVVFRVSIKSFFIIK